MLWSFSSRDVSSNVVRTNHNFDNLYFHYQGGLIMKRKGHKKLREKLLYLYRHVRDHHWWGKIEKSILCIYLSGPEKKKENLTLTNDICCVLTFVRTNFLKVFDKLESFLLHNSVPGGNKRLDKKRLPEWNN